MFGLSRPASTFIRSPQFIRVASTKQSSAAHIKSLDHLVLTVKSIPKTTEWYSQNLGMHSESFVSTATPDITRHSLIFGSQKINLHELGKEFEPKALRVKDGSADLCFLTDDDVKEVRQRLITAGVEMVDLGNEKSDEGIVNRTGARAEFAGELKLEGMIMIEDEVVRKRKFKEEDDTVRAAAE